MPKQKTKIKQKIKGSLIWQPFAKLCVYIIVETTYIRYWGGKIDIKLNIKQKFSSGQNVTKASKNKNK